MARVIVTEHADRDIVVIVAYISRQAGTKTAAKFAQAIDARIDGFRDFPGTGAPRPELGPNVRIALVDPNVIIHDWIDDDVHILRVVHGRRKQMTAMIP
jgi:plasmid stabilization system protein ParE